LSLDAIVYVINIILYQLNSYKLYLWRFHNIT